MIITRLLQEQIRVKHGFLCAALQLRVKGCRLWKGRVMKVNKIQSFMQVYMYELEQFLNTKKEELKTVSFQSDEANTDRPLKEFLKNVIEQEFVQIPRNTQVTGVISKDEGEVGIEELREIRVLRVLLPEEITEEIKTIISANRNVVYANPDMCLEILMEGKRYYETVELKSTKKDTIPGSSVQQIVPEEWVVFIKHSVREIEIVTGQYIHAINAKIQFPDRSPRPQVSFQEMQTWNQNNRVLEYARLLYKRDAEEAVKYELIDDWQSILAQRWIDMLFDTTPVKKEPWFHNSMRKFIVAFLERYEKMSETEKADLVCRIKSQISRE